jgi:hypothetical protein
MSTSRSDVIAKMHARAAQIPTPALCDALKKLDGPGMDEAERLTRSVLIDVLTERHPEADAAFNAWAEDDTTTGSGGAVEVITKAALAAARKAAPDPEHSARRLDEPAWPGEDITSRQWAGQALTGAGVSAHHAARVLSRAYSHMEATAFLPGTDELAHVGYDRETGRYEVTLPPGAGAR